MLLSGTIIVAMGMTLSPSIYTTWIFVVTSPKYRFIYELIILLVGTIMVAMGLTLYHSVYTTWVSLWLCKKKKCSPLRFNLFNMWYTWHGFVVPLPKIRYMFTNEIYSLSRHVHDMAFIVTPPKYSLRWTTRFRYTWANTWSTEITRKCLERGLIFKQNELVCTRFEQV
jgi:hypothetical protein